jgi:hypothetical protein
VAAVPVRNYLLIDLENRQPDPKHVENWIGALGEAWIFFGEQQIKLLPKYWVIGNQIEVVPIFRPGKNSMDFHVMLYLGYLVAKRKRAARFVVVAADAGYDPAIAHARRMGVNVERVADLGAVPQD